MNLVSKQFQPKGRFSLKLALNYLKHSNSAVLEKVGLDQYCRVFTFDGQLCLVSMTESANNLVLSVQGQSVTESMLSQAEAKMRQIFSLDKDPLPFIQMTAGDRILNSVTHEGLRPVLLADPYESLLWSIIGQQVNTTFAKRLKLKLIELCKCNVEINGDIYGYLPSAQQVAQLDPIGQAFVGSADGRRNVF